MKKPITIGLIAVIAVILGIGVTANAEDDFLTYENSDMGIRIDYPSDWTVDDTGLGNVDFNSPQDSPNNDFLEQMSVEIEYLNEPIGLDEYVEVLIEGLEFAGFSEIDSWSTALADNPAKTLTFLMEIEGQEILVIQIITIKDDAAYLLVLTTSLQSKSTYMPIFEKMVDSFEISSASETTEKDVPSTELDAEPAESTQIPDWVRSNAEWWAQGAIGDSDFVLGIQYLIKEGIMTIPETAQGTTSDDSQEIPSWIKNNADWWAQGLITDDDFVKGIQYLIEEGIMSV